MENHDTSTINSSVRYCLVKPGDKVRITKTHRADIHQYSACEGDTFIITKVTDDQIPYGRWLQPSGVLAASELKLDPNCCTLLTPAATPEPITLRNVTIDVRDPKAAHKAVDEACAEYQASQTSRWSTAETCSAKLSARRMMATLYEQGVSMVWFIESDPDRRHVCLECNHGTSDTWAKSHGYSTNYVQITFNKNVDFDEWIGRYACLCALTGEPVADIVMRNIKIDT
jgi:hypothetical protein